MPLYDYACTKCGRVHEVRHGFDESHSEPCASCGAPLRRVFNAAPVLFKGSGFYVTDSRKVAKGTSTPGKSDAPAAKADTASAEAKPAESKPAESKPTETKAAQTKSAEPAA
jgi:putative FmdB family regulatory protein